MPTIRAEIGTTGDIETIDVSGVASVDIAEAVRLEHPCSDSSCDIARALDDDYPLWAANLLQGATECPLVDAAVAHYFPDRCDFDKAADVERDAWLESPTWTEHAHRCPGCDGFTFGDDYWTPDVCENCGATL